MVYDDAEVLYSEIKKDGETLLEEAFQVLYPHTHRVDLSSPLGKGELIGHNTTPFARRDVVALELGSAGKNAPKGTIVQTNAAGNTGYALFESETGQAHALCRGMFADCTPASGTLGYRND
jgi:alpha-mannosidase